MPDTQQQLRVLQLPHHLEAIFKPSVNAATVLGRVFGIGVMWNASFVESIVDERLELLPGFQLRRDIGGRIFG